MIRVKNNAIFKKRLLNGLKPQILFTKMPVSESGRTAYEIRNKAAFAAIRDDGSVVTWGDPTTGGDSSKVIDQLAADVVQILRLVKHLLR